MKRHREINLGFACVLGLAAAIGALAGLQLRWGSPVATAAVGQPFPVIAFPAAAAIQVDAAGSDLPGVGVRGDRSKPVLTLNRAMTLAQAGDTIYVGNGTFAPITVPIPAYVKIIGSGRPHLDSATAPTQLVGGTIIQGPLYAWNDGFELWHAGIDSGLALHARPLNGVDGLAISNVPLNTTITIASGTPAGTFTVTCVDQTDGTFATTGAIPYTSSNATIQADIQALHGVGAGNCTVTGTAGNWLLAFAIQAFVICDDHTLGIGGVNNSGLTGGTLTATLTHPTGIVPLKGVQVHDVIDLGSDPNNLAHASRIENVDGCTVDGLHSGFATHAVAFKGTHSNLNDILAFAGGTSGLIVKSDDYAPCHDSNFTNIICQSIGSSGAASHGALLAGRGFHAVQRQRYEL